MQFTIIGNDIRHQFLADSVDIAKARAEALAALLDQSLTMHCGVIEPGKGEMRLVFDAPVHETTDAVVAHDELKLSHKASAAPPPPAFKSVYPAPKP